MSREGWIFLAMYVTWLLSMWWNMACVKHGGLLLAYQHIEQWEWDEYRQTASRVFAAFDEFDARGLNWHARNLSPSETSDDVHVADVIRGEMG